MRYMSRVPVRFGHAAHREKEHGFVDVVVDDEHQGHEPAQVVHQAQAEHGIAHLADGGVGEQPLGVLLEDRQQVADQGGAGADPEQQVGQFDAIKLLLAHGHEQDEEAEEAGLEQDARDHGGHVRLRLGVGAGEPDVQPQGGGLGHEAKGQQGEDPAREGCRYLGKGGQCQRRRALGRQGEARQDEEGATQGEEEVGQGMGLRGLAAQDEEIGAQGQQFPGGEEFKAVLGEEEDRQAGVHQQGRGVEARPPAMGIVAGEQGHGSAHQEDDGEDEAQGVVQVVAGGKEGQQAGNGQGVLDPGRQPFQSQEEEGES
jgi:hypothetical protein